MAFTCQFAGGNCKIRQKLREKPGRKWFARALLCISDNANGKTCGARIRSAAACPCAKEIQNIVSKGEKFSFGVMGIRHSRGQVVFKDFSQALMQDNMPIYTRMDIFRRPSRIARLVFKEQPQIMAHFGALSLGTVIKKAMIMVAGFTGFAALLLDKNGALQTGIYQFVAENGLETAYKIFFGAVATAALLWGISIENASGAMAREAQRVLCMIVEAADENMKGMQRKRNDSA